MKVGITIVLILWAQHVVGDPVDPDSKRFNSQFINCIDAFRSICEMVEAKGYVCTAINITTRDGYILTNFRMTSSSTPQKRSVALLWHGLLDNRSFFL
jgi:hypothetical protein